METKVIGASLLVMMVFLLGVVAYDITLHPAGPEIVGIATAKILGSGHFRGEIGTSEAGTTFTFEGEAPATVGVPFTRADYVAAVMEEPPEGLQIQVKGRTVQESSGTVVMWKVPRGYQPSKSSEF